MKHQKLSTSEVLDWLENNPDKEASDLLRRYFPRAEAKFTSLDRKIGALLKEVRQVFPDAEFYTTGGDGFALLLGPSHSDCGEAQQELVALDGADKYREDTCRLCGDAVATGVEYCPDCDRRWKPGESKNAKPKSKRANPEVMRAIQTIMGAAPHEIFGV